MEKKHKNEKEKKNHQMRNFPCHFTAEQCRSALGQWCFNPKEMKGLHQGSTY